MPRCERNFTSGHSETSQSTKSNEIKVISKKDLLRNIARALDDSNLTDNSQFYAEDVLLMDNIKIEIDGEDDLQKARNKLKAVESELVTEAEEHPLKRKRKRCKRCSCNGDEASSDDSINPTSEDVYQLKIPKLTDNISPVNSLGPELREEASEVTYQEKELNTVSSPVPEPSGLSSVDSHDDVSTPVSMPVILLNKASHQELDVLNNIARQLANIDGRLTEIERNQKKILENLSLNHSSTFIELPSEVKLPCDSVEDVNKLEEWLMSEDNAKALMVNLSILGGKKTPHTVRRILEKLFTNNVAACYNWTGRLNKFALKDLTITRIIPGTVRRNQNTANATDNEIYEVMTNWFRFCKDREGGRYLRMKNNNKSL